MSYIISKETDRLFDEMDKAIRETDIMDAGYFWKTTGAFYKGDISIDEWSQKLTDNICEHISKHITEELKKQGKI